MAGLIPRTASRMNLAHMVLQRNLSGQTRLLRTRSMAENRAVVSAENDARSHRIARQTPVLTKAMPVAADHGLIRQEIAYVPLPIAKVGPLYVNGRQVQVPLANVDEELIHRVSLGIRAIDSAGGSFASIFRDSITVSPLVTLPSIDEAAAFATYVESPKQMTEMRQWFAEISSFVKLESVRCNLIGRRMFVRFTTSGGDHATSDTTNKGIERVFQHLKQSWTGSPFQVLPDLLEAVDASGKHVTAEATIPVDVLSSILSTDVETVVATFAERQTVKAQIMQSAAARRLVAGLMLATGQDVSQPAVSANAVETSCEILRSPVDESIITALKVKCVIPSIEVDTSGSATTTQSAQRDCLQMLNVNGTNLDVPGANGQRLAEVICATLLAFEIGALSERQASKRILLAKPRTRLQQSPSKSNTAQQQSGMIQQRAMSPPAPPQEAMRGMMTMAPSANVSGKARNSGNQAYLELVAEKCAAEFGWADPRLTVP